MDPYIGEIRMVGFNFAPQGWAVCNGQLLPISQYTALFSLLGTYYGGDGKSTFALPNLQGSAAMHTGGSPGPGLTPRTLGETGGEANVQLITTQIPAHNHGGAMQASQGDPRGNSGSPTNLVPAGNSNANVFAKPGGVNMNPGMLGISGGSQPHNNMQPYLTVLFVIALQGVFPPRS